MCIFSYFKEQKKNIMKKINDFFKAEYFVEAYIDL